MIYVRNLGKHAEGYWTAEAGRENPENHWINYRLVHRKFGSWMHGHGATMFEVAPDVCAELQRQVKKLERKEK